jgi:NAD(P)-dependent dehydrogenase (short-subunit alcohol dehydrogenase family)
MKNYLIIGGSSGIGLQSVKLLEGKGHNVYATYNSSETPDHGTNVRYFRHNVLEDENTFDHLPDAIDGLVYCPGTIHLKPFHRIKPETFREDYDLQVIGAIKTIQAVLPRLKKAEASSIVLFSTIAVQTGFNFHSVVSASKGAIEGLTRALAAEFAPLIRVNCIAPSLTDTPLAKRLLSSPEKIDSNAQRHPLKRIGKVNDIAGAVAFLLDDNSGWMTGQVLKIDGGLSSIRL